jgi:hypothetical protein
MRWCDIPIATSIFAQFAVGLSSRSEADANKAFDDCESDKPLSLQPTPTFLEQRRI